MAKATLNTVKKALVVIGICAVAAIGVPAAGAGAQDDSPADPGVRCGAKIGPGEYEFYMPGAKVTDVNGNKWVCGPDGMWFRDYSAVRASTIDRAPVGGLQSSTLTGSKMTTSTQAMTFQMAR